MASTRRRALIRGVRWFSSSKVHSADADAQYCLDLVKRSDYESYLIGLLMPRPARRAYFALRAFNVEIATVKDQVPKMAQQAGRMRFNHWRDILLALGTDGSLPKHVNQPVASELQRAVVENNLPVRWLERCVEARQEDLFSGGMLEDYDALETMVEKGHSSLLYLVLQLLGQQDREELQYAASHIGVCNGIVTLLRGYSHHASTGSICIPRTVLSQFAVPHKAALSGPVSDEQRKALQDATHDVASQAHAHLDKGREWFAKGGGQALPAFLGAVSSASYLEALRQADFDPFLTSLTYAQRTPLKHQFGLVKAMVTKSF